QRLASSPEFDIANSEQLGLFVVGRLAARQGIKVSLRESVYGGTTAVLLMPFGVIVREEEAGRPAEQDDWLVAHARATANGTTAASAGAARELELEQPGMRALPPPPAASSRSWDPEALAPWSQAFQPPVARQRPVPEPADTPAAPGPAGSTSSHLGMPIRVPQASLAPQLQRRDVPARQQQQPAREATSRSPEAHRDLMILMQQGWQRGRVDDLDDPEGAPDNGND